MKKATEKILEDGSQKNVKSIFNKASVGKIGSAAKWLAQFVVWPMGKYQFPIYFAFIFGVAPLTGMLFPKAEDFLENENIDTTIMEDLGVKGERINIRHFNTVGSIHEFTVMPNLPAFLFNNISRKNRGVDGYVEYTDIVALRLVAGCRVTVPSADKKYDIKDILDTSDRQNRLHTIFHEFRHCSPENKALDTFTKEVDADYYGAVVTGKATNDEDFIKKQMYMRAPYMEDFGYNNSLYFDAKLNNKLVPSMTEMRRANNKFKAMYDNKCVVLGKETDKLTLRRALLYLEYKAFVYSNIRKLKSKSVEQDSKLDKLNEKRSKDKTTTSSSSSSNELLLGGVKYVETKSQCKI